MTFVPLLSPIIAAFIVAMILIYAASAYLYPPSSHELHEDLTYGVIILACLVAMGFVIASAQ